MPASSNNRSTPNCANASTAPFWAGLDASKAYWAAGQSAPSTDGPSSRPPISGPITAGWPRRCMISARIRPTRISTITSPRNAISMDVDAAPSAAEAAEPSVRLAAVPTRTAPRRARQNVVMLLAMTLLGRPRTGSGAGLARVPRARHHEKGKDAGEQSDGHDQDAIGVSHHEG